MKTYILCFTNIRTAQEVGFVATVRPLSKIEQIAILSIIEPKGLVIDLAITETIEYHGQPERPCKAPIKDVRKHYDLDCLADPELPWILKPQAH